jgi:hypothetical protein
VDDRGRRLPGQGLSHPRWEEHQHLACRRVRVDGPDKSQARHATTPP